MTTLPTTSESTIRERLLDLLFAQWASLGVPYGVPSQARSRGEIIDPEALLWCSLEFLPTEPRLREGVLGWLSVNRTIVLKSRLKRPREVGDPRHAIWAALDPKRSHRSNRPVPTVPCHGLSDTAEVTAFADTLADELVPRESASTQIGSFASHDAALLLRARDAIGSDARHFILIYLLARTGGAAVSEIASWSGYSHRSLAETLERLDRAGVVKTRHGSCRLRDPDPWLRILQADDEHPLVVDWFNAFDAVVTLLRDLAKARRNGISDESEVVRSLRTATVHRLDDAGIGDRRASEGQLHFLRHAVADG